MLSIGFRCMNKGYTFVWPAGERPYFILPKSLGGKLVCLDVDGDIPYLVPGKHAQQPPKGKRCFACGCVAMREADVVVN